MKKKSRRRYFKLRVMVYCLVGVAVGLHFLILRGTITVTTSETTNQQQLRFGILPSSHQQDYYDPTILHRHPVAYSMISDYNNQSICDPPPGVGEEGPAGIRGLYKLRQSHLLQVVADGNNKDEARKSRTFNVKILCMIYTHSNRHDVVRSIASTYGPHCDGFLAFSNVTDPTIGALAVPHVGPESYDNMWNKVRSMWQFIQDQHLVDQYDFFHIGGDDMYVLPNNLRQFISDELSQVAKSQPLYMGASIPNAQNPERRFCGGGAGYTLNALSVTLLVQHLFRHPDCAPALASDEDVRIARCFDIAGIQCMDTNDRNQEMRYHHLDVHFHAAWVPTRLALWHWEKLHYFHNITGNQKQLAQISNTTISFHLDKGTIRSRSRDRGIRRYHAILYGLCGNEFDQRVQQAGTCTSEERLKLRKQWEETPRSSEQ